MKLREKTTATILIALFMISAIAFVTPAMANEYYSNTVESSTMHFQGELIGSPAIGYTTTTDLGGPIIDTGTEIAMTAGTYYIPGGPGTTEVSGVWITPDGLPAQGGFDVYAKEGATAYILDYYGAETGTMGSYVIGTFGAHDAYPEDPGPWGGWWTPDCADWDKYSLELTEDHWYLRYTISGESSMSGTLVWFGDGTGYAAETDKGTEDLEDDGGPFTVYDAGGPQMWDWDAGDQVEQIPLEYPGFDVTVTEVDGIYHVILTPAPSTDHIPLTGYGAYPKVSINVEQTSVDFGNLIAGGAPSETKTIYIRNTGECGVTVTAELRDEVPIGFYTSNLKLDTLSITGWNDLGHSISMSVPDFIGVNLVLSVPKAGPVGTYTAILVFWAEQA